MTCIASNRYQGRLHSSHISSDARLASWCAFIRDQVNS